MKNVGKIFVYGTLKVGGVFAKDFNDKRLVSIPAKAEGTMYVASGWYPAVIFGEGGTIHGELHEYKDIERVLAALDRIEGCSDPEGSSINLYNRKEVEVETIDGKKEIVLSYEFNRGVETLEVIDSGVWEI